MKISLQAPPDPNSVKDFIRSGWVAAGISRIEACPELVEGPVLSYAEGPVPSPVQGPDGG